MIEVAGCIIPAQITPGMISQDETDCDLKGSDPAAEALGAIPHTAYTAEGRRLEGNLQGRQDDVEVDREGRDNDQSDQDLLSLSNSVKSHDYSNGRRYHGYRQGRYPHPNDEQESNREDMKHHAIKLLLGGQLSLAPIANEPRRVLDVGTGTGIWAIEFADEYPSAEVVGVDLSPIQPMMVPPNVHFEIDDLEEDWTYGASTFDFIHVRHMFTAIRSWPQLLSQAMHSLAPGGYIELCEMDIIPTSDDNSIPEHYPLRDYFAILTRAAATRGVDMSIAPRLASLLTTAGFEDVVEVPMKLPLGTWPRDQHLKEVGLWHREQFLEGLQGIILRYLITVEGWNVEEVELFLVEVRRCIKDRRIHCYWKVYVAYGRKPLSG